MRTIVEQCSGYVGGNPTERGRGAASEALMTPEEFLQYLNKKVLHDRNNEIVEYRFATGERIHLSRVDYWDLCVNQFGELPVLADTDTLFNFLPTVEPAVTPRGLNVKNKYFDIEEFRSPGTHFLMGDKGRMRVWYDPRNWDQVWVRDLDACSFMAIPNVLRDMTEMPLIDSFLDAGRKMQALRGATPSSEKAYMRQWAAAVIESGRQALEDGPLDVATSRDLVDYDRSLHVQGQAAEQGLILPTERTLKPSMDIDYDPLPDLDGDGL